MLPNNMNEQTKVLSIITVCFNAASTIKRTIDSVVDQKNSKIEFIIIDGASTDTTIEYVKQYGDTIDLFISEPDTGIYDAMNKGLNKAKGKWVFFLGSDDVLVPDCVERLLTYLSSDVDVVFGKVIFTNNRIVESFLNYRTIFQNTLHHQSAIYRRKLFEEFRYSTSFKILSDYELNLVLFLKKCKYIKTDLIISECYEYGASSNIALSIYETNEIRKKHVDSVFINTILSNLLVLYYEQKKYRKLFANFFRRRKK